MIFFSATDIGGARALLPVMDTLYKHDVPFCLLDGGVLSDEAGKDYQRISRMSVDSEQRFNKFIFRNKIRLLCVGTAVADRLPVFHSVWATQKHIPTVAVLDNWMNYTDRFILEKHGLCFPDYYFVMDQLAFHEAVKDGVPESILEISGHPGLASLGRECDRFNKQELLVRAGVKNAEKHVVFVSEPASMDQGFDDSFPNYRGYTEFDVINILARFFADLRADVQLLVLPHPRENSEVLARYCNDAFHDQSAWLIPGVHTGREAILLADGVLGMTSILLYEAWLLNKPVASLQPRLRKPGLNHLLQRSGCLFADTEKSCIEVLDEWWGKLSERDQLKMSKHPDLDIHRSAPEYVSNRLIEIWHST